MTLNMAQLHERIEREFPDAEQVSKSVIRFVRAAADRPFAIYYLDIADELPSTIDDLTRYQDDVIGKRYFEGRKSLQWSNYLYFLRSEDKLAQAKAQQAKELIENDRTYARKFVVPEDNLEDVLRPRTVAPTGDERRENVLSTWVDLLTEAGLERAILSNDDLPARLRRIEIGSGGGDKRAKLARHHSVEPAQSLASLVLEHYRPFPIRRTFEFGTVNLIFGPNASGKTSLLEAIELFYCGLNNRNPGLRPQYEFDAVLADGTAQRATSHRRPQLFRDRNLAWYGQPEIKTNHLYKSFARFNFLDADAAASLSESAEHIEDDLSKLLVGPDASKIWRDIGRVGVSVRLKLNDLRPHQRQMETEFARLEKQLSEAANERQKSDSILARLSKMCARYDWRLETNEDADADADEGALENFIGSLAEMISLTKQMVEIRWVGAPVTFSRLANYRWASTALVNNAEPDVESLERAEKERAQLARARIGAKQALDLTMQARRFIDAGVPERAAEHRRLDEIIVSCSSQLAAFQPEYMDVFVGREADGLIAAAERKATQKRIAADARLGETRNEYTKFTRLRAESENLAQQLRQIANTLLERAEDPEECPLCHTRFEPGELATHMSIGLDKHFESLGQSLLDQIHEQEATLNEAKRVEAALIWLSAFAERLSMKSETTVSEAAARVRAVNNDLVSARARFESLEQEIEQLTRAGLSGEELTRLVSHLNDLGFSIESVSQDTVEQLEASIQQRISTLSEQLAALSDEIASFQTSLHERFGVEGGAAEIRQALSRTKEKLATTDSILTHVEKLRERFPWSDDRSISELIVAGEAIREVAAEAQSCLDHERQARQAQSDDLSRKEQLQEQLNALSQQIERFSKAQTVLNKIRKDHSLSAAMEETLRLNRAAIESVFSSIHSPAEFSGLGSSLASLIRKSDGSEAKLTEISTGQRAAFALSLFLAQNSQLTVAPPVILIDDPIAHVDDLNSLSFLDYLRETVIAGRRQIFFATADDKLATLFERKFDFMGDGEFRRFNLSRIT